jgi:flagellar L-ring protein precursor FlgH
MNKRTKQLGCLLGVFVILGGCASSPPPSQPMGENKAVESVTQAAPDSDISASRHGSLWQADSQLNNLFVAIKARRVGDIVTVKIEESAKATNKANTGTERNSGLEAGIQKLFGVGDWWTNEVLPDVPSSLPKLTPFGNPSVKGDFKSTFKGDGETSRSGTLSAYMTCRVVDVMPNGNLKIVGNREVMVNHENQLIILSGVIRPRDISEDNIVDSKFISDAKIAYSGSGVIDDRQRPGWMANLLNNLWPF